MEANTKSWDRGNTMIYRPWWISYLLLGAVVYFALQGCAHAPTEWGMDDAEYAVEEADRLHEEAVRDSIMDADFAKAFERSGR